MNIALVTGGSRGIGKEICKQLAINGYKVVINYYKSEKEAKKLENELNNLGLNAIAIYADIRKKSDVLLMKEKILKVFGNVDVLINNSAISQIKLFTDYTSEDYDVQLDTNLGGMFNCTQVFLPSMISNKFGNIINISSMWGITGSSCEVLYSMTKAGIIGFTKALAKEVGLSNVRVNCIAPGLIETEMNKNIEDEVKDIIINETPLNRMGQALDVANLVIFLASNKASFITGEVINCNGGYLI